MATSRGFAQFSRRIDVLMNKFVGNTEKTIRAAAIAADQALVNATPVDTGRARSNWLAAINSVSEPADDTIIRSADETVQEAKGVIAGWRLGAGPIFISNSLPYIVPLEEGHSAQAPAGMTPQGIAAAQAVIRRAKLLK